MALWASLWAGQDLLRLTVPAYQVCCTLSHYSTDSFTETVVGASFLPYSHSQPPEGYCMEPQSLALSCLDRAVHLLRIQLNKRIWPLAVSQPASLHKDGWQSSGKLCAFVFIHLPEASTELRIPRSASKPMAGMVHAVSTQGARHFVHRTRAPASEFAGGISRKA